MDIFLIKEKQNLKTVTNMVNISILTILGCRWNYMCEMQTAKRIATGILAIEKLNRKQALDLRGLQFPTRHLQDIWDISWNSLI